MEETHAQENARLLAPYETERNRIAHECLTAMLDNRHTDAGQLLQEYQLHCLHVESARRLVQWFDDADPIDPD